MGRGLSTRPGQLASFLSPSPRNTPQTGAALASCSHPDCATSAARPRPLVARCCCEGPSAGCKAPVGSACTTRSVKRAACQREQRPDAAPNGPRLSRERCDTANRLAASARTVGPPDETRPGQRASPWRPAEPTRPCPRNKVWTLAPQCPIPHPFHGCALSSVPPRATCSARYAHSLFLSCIAIAAQIQFAPTDSCPTAHPGKERVGRRASNGRAING
jgi:hypothetical protein